MTSIFGDITTDGIETAKDNLGGGAARFLDTGVYPSTIEVAYTGQSTGGAHNVTLKLKTDCGVAFDEVIYVTSGKQKGQKNFYVDKDGKEQFLPGFNILNNICLVAAGIEVGGLSTTEIHINKYDYDAKKDLPTPVQSIDQLKDVAIKIGVVKVEKSKKKNVAADGQPANWVATGETKFENELKVVFCVKPGHEDKTGKELQSQTPADFLPLWAEKYTADYVDDQTEKLASGAGKPAGGAPAAAAPETSLFG